MTAASHTTERRRARRALIAAAFLLTLVATAAGAAGAAPPEEPPARGSAGKTPDETWASLDETAKEQGRVPVLVALAVPGVDAGGPGSATAEGRRAIGAAADALLRDLGADSSRRLKTTDAMPLLSFHARPGDLAKLRRSPHVLLVAEDREHDVELPQSAGDDGRAVGAPQQPESTGAGVAATTSNGLVTHVGDWWDYYRIGVDRARAYGWTGSGQTVAVLDTGVDRNHAWLAGRVVAEACFSTTYVGSTFGNCPNGTNRQFGTGAAQPCWYSPLCAHGTHVAHTAAGHWGVGSGAGIVAVQVFHATAADPRVYDSDIVWALSHVYSLRSTYRIAAVNMSIGGGGYTGYCDNQATDGSIAATYVTGWIKALKDVGIATVVSSGNDDYVNAVSAPACISHAVSVGNTTLTAAGADAVFGRAWNGERWIGSNSNATLDLLAPGTDICSAVPTAFDADGVDCNYIGTSMAAPHVAGAFAVLRQYRPYATVDQIQTALRLSGPGVYDDRNGVTRTRIDVFAALSRL